MDKHIYSNGKKNSISSQSFGIFHKSWNSNYFLFLLYLCLQYAKEFNNFHLLVAVISAFSHPAVLRLKWTQERVSKKAKQVIY